MLIKLRLHNDEETTDPVLFDLKAIREPQQRTIFSPSVLEGVVGAEPGKSYYVSHITLDIHEGRIISVFDLNRLGN